MTRLAGRHVALGVSGGIACYKSVTLARRLTEGGAAVDVILTRSAAEFVRPLTFEAVTGRSVITSLWEPGRALAHISLAREPDLVILAPATAQLLARAAQGMADDFLTALLLARTGPVVCAPAMNDRMYAQARTQDHCRALAQHGWTFVGPEEGPLAEGDAEGPGRMSEPETIVAASIRVLASLGSAWLGRRVLVTAGPTREWIDNVRLISNPSTGRMGFALAAAAWTRGAEVTLIAGPTTLSPPSGPRLVRIDTTAELLSAVSAELPSADVLIMAAAPADFQPLAQQPGKRPRAGETLDLEFSPTPDVLIETAPLRKPELISVGFSLEAGGGLERAREKLAKKALDAIVFNDALEPGAGFAVDTNRVTIVRNTGVETALPVLPKHAVAEAVLDVVEELL